MSRMPTIIRSRFTIIRTVDLDLAASTEDEDVVLSLRIELGRTSDAPPRYRARLYELCCVRVAVPFGEPGEGDDADEAVWQERSYFKQEDSFDIFDSASEEEAYARVERSLLDFFQWHAAG